MKLHIRFNEKSKTIFLCVIFTFILFINLEAQNAFPIDKGYDIYLVGEKYFKKSPHAVLWKNAEIQILSKYASAKCIAVDNNNVYVGGYEEESNYSNVKIATIWKNGVPTRLESYNSCVNDICVKDGNVYAVGYIEACDDLRHLYYTVAVLWENGNPTMLADIGPSSNAYSIVIKNDDMYIAGMIGGALTLWRNKESAVKIGTPIQPMFISNYNAKVAVDNNKNVFIICEKSGYYKNREFMKVEPPQNDVAANENIDKKLMAHSRFNDIFINNDSLYVVGEDGAMNPFVFNNNKVTYLRDWNLGKRVESATCIYVINNDVFIGGYEQNGNRMFNPIIWKNGVKQHIEYDKLNGSFIRDIVVVPKK